MPLYVCPLLSGFGCVLLRRSPGTESRPECWSGRRFGRLSGRLNITPSLLHIATPADMRSPPVRHSVPVGWRCVTPSQRSCARACAVGAAPRIPVPGSNRKALQLMSSTYQLGAIIAPADGSSSYFKSQLHSFPAQTPCLSDAGICGWLKL